MSETICLQCHDTGIVYKAFMEPVPIVGPPPTVVRPLRVLKVEMPCDLCLAGRLQRRYWRERAMRGE